jgi:thiamine biosynthesis lipoprotein
MNRMELDEIKHTVILSVAPVRIDLGGIGKGYALDRMAALLREWDINAALIHGGRSSILALDHPAGTEGWPVRLTNPEKRKRPLGKLGLHNQALGGSGVRKGDHILNPRTGMPVQGRVAAWCRAPTAAIADALSTAFMVMSMDKIELYCSTHPDTAGIIVAAGDTTADNAIVHRYGVWEEGDSRL